MQTQLVEVQSGLSSYPRGPRLNRVLAILRCTTQGATA
jgi:hypothetical protein